MNTNIISEGDRAPAFSLPDANQDIKGLKGFEDYRIEKYRRYGGGWLT